jgi:hypothetical protein
MRLHLRSFILLVDVGFRHRGNIVTYVTFEIFTAVRWWYHSCGFHHRCKKLKFHIQWLNMLHAIMFLLWILAACRPVGKCERFRWTYCLCLQGWTGDAGKWRGIYNAGFDSMFLRNVGNYRRVYTAVIHLWNTLYIAWPWRTISQLCSRFLCCILF